jgi:HSP20 family protein
MNMALMRRTDIWDPMRELEEIGNRFSRLFGMTRPGGESEREGVAVTAWAPACDIVETEKEYRIRLELPDVKKEDVHLTLDHGVLIVQGERKEEKEEEHGTFHRRELKYGTFVRRFTLPENVDTDKMDARFRDGMLAIGVPKSEAKQPQAKEITIH